MEKFDYLIVGAGLFGCTFAHEALKHGKTVLILEQRDHIGGNCYTELNNGIIVHKYGPHIFHTNSERIWNYIQQFSKFNHFVYRPKVNYKGEIYSFPINLLTLYQLFGVRTPKEAEEYIKTVRQYQENPQNIRDYIISELGEKIYKMFYDGYSKKQWGIDPSQIPCGIAKRIPYRLNFDDNYYLDKYTGQPENGYTPIFRKMTDSKNCHIEYGVNYLENRYHYDGIAKKTVYTGSPDEFYEYRFGKLPYRSLRFEHEYYHINDYQGVAVINYTSIDVPYTRITEHKHFLPRRECGDFTIITKEYPLAHEIGMIPYYPINNINSKDMYKRYKELMAAENRILFGGRLGSYQYLDMDQVIGQALVLASKEFES